jgi:hypothetical protein
MIEETQNSAPSTQAVASQNVADRLSKQVAVPLFEAALLRLRQGWTHGEVVTLFNGRVSWNTVQDWRRGRRRVPQWAWNYLGVLLDQNIAATASVRDSVRNPPNIAPGQGSHRNIAAWNQRRAALAAKKKEAGD